MLNEIGELVFSLVVGYMGALEFLYVVRHLYHWSFQHNPEMRDYKSEAESLRKLQEQLKNAIAEAKEKEAMGLKAMKDGVKYLDGFRVDDDQKKIEELKEKVRIQEKKAERQREIEAELERQRKIEEETKRQLKKAEEELRRVEEEKVREKQKAEEEHRRAEEEKVREKQKAEAEKRRAEEEKVKEKQKAENEKRKAEEEKRKAEEQRQKQAEEEENTRKILEAERKKEQEQRIREEQEENERKLIQAEKEREEQQRLQEIEDEKVVQKLLAAEREREREEEKTRKLIEAEKEREAIERQRQLDEENVQKLVAAERQREEEQRLRELEEEAENQRQVEEQQRIVQMEREKVERERKAEEELQILQERAAALEKENNEKLLAAEREAELKQREIEENEENMQNLLKAERELELKKQEMEEEAENLRRLIEAEKEMEERQRRVDEEALQKFKHAQEEVELRQAYDEEAEASEVPFVKKEAGQGEQAIPPTQTVKTQYGQTVSESLKPKALLFPGVSEESSSAEPISSVQSSFSTQQSSEAVQPDIHFDEYERQAPDGGEDMPSLQYSDDYLRSLDGIKNKPLVREDGSGRRRAFKKRRSSGSSTSSRESRASREEELKMFTSLEEEESEKTRKGESEYETIKYASEPNLKVTKQRRHKRSPAKDAKRDANEAGSLQMLDEEDSNPWGEVKPENYKNTEFWKREKNLSIDEELDTADAEQRIQSPSAEATHLPKMSSFEEATKSQHEEAISALKRQRSKDPEPIREPEEESDTKNVSKVANARQSPNGSFSPPASTSASASASSSVSPALISPEPKRERSLEAEDAAARTPSPTTGLRRSPRVDEMKQYEEKWKSEDRKARAEAADNPAIEIDPASDDELMPQPDELLMEGISDFYDFNASINKSRSRSRSRSKTPAVNRSVSLPERRTPSPQNKSHHPAKTRSRSPSPDPASYKFIYQRILPSLATDQPPPDKSDEGLSDFYDFNSKLNRETLTGSIKRRSSDVHRTSVDYVLEDLRNDKLGEGGAIAKQLDRLRTTPNTPEYERTISDEMRDIEKLKEEMMTGSFKRSTYVGESMDFSDQFAESLREEAKYFRRSRSRSRSPVYDIEEMTARVLAKKNLQETILEDIVKSSENIGDFSSEITKAVVDRNRRASDTVLIQKPEILFQIQDLIQETDENFNIIDLEGDDYHHFRRFSLGQEIPEEQYPEDCTYISEIEIKPLRDLSAWTGDLESSINVEGLEHEENVPSGEDPYESGSDDERQTVVEVDDEIDEDIWDYNERPEESHNEQSECEEADREMDRYAGRNADDWRDVEGAVGGVSDEDSFQIDQIYGEAIKNRKPSGIERDYDSILQEIQISDEDRLEEEIFIEKPSFFNGTSGGLEPGLWSPRSRSSRASSRESSRSFIEYEKRDNERRYLADPTLEAINSTRLRSRYGIVPSTSLPTGFEDNDITDIDVNYVPKKEYNWRKNFKLDDDTETKSDDGMQYLDTRKFSLGGESITLFSQSPDHSGGEAESERKRVHDDIFDEEKEQEMEDIDKPSKKKKSRRKSRKGSKGSIGGSVEEDKESLSRRSSIVTEGDLPKKKSRRGSKGVIDSVPETADRPTLQDDETEDLQSKKKSKKRRKQAKEEITLPKLDIIVPTPQKKAPPPSVAALLAALSTPPPPPEVKTPVALEKPKKLWEVKTPSPEVKTSPSSEKPKKPWEVKTPLPEVKTSPSSEKPRKLWEVKSPTAEHENSAGSGPEKPKKLWEVKTPSQEVKTVSDKSKTLVDVQTPKDLVPEVPLAQSPAKDSGMIASENQNTTQSAVTSTDEADHLPSKVTESTNSPQETQPLPNIENNSKKTDEPMVPEPSPLRTQTSSTVTSDSSTSLKNDQTQLPVTIITEDPSSAVGEKEKSSEPENLANKTSSHDPNTATTSTLSPIPFTRSRSRTPEPIKVTTDIIEDAGLYPLCTVAKSAQTQSQNTPESDIIKDGGLYPLF